MMGLWQQGPELKYAASAFQTSQTRAYISDIQGNADGRGLQAFWIHRQDRAREGLTGGRLAGILLRERYSRDVGSLSALRMGLCCGLRAGDLLEPECAWCRVWPARSEAAYGASEMLASSEDAWEEAQNAPEAWTGKSALLPKVSLQKTDCRLSTSIKPSCLCCYRERTFIRAKEELVDCCAEPKRTIC